MLYFDNTTRISTFNSTVTPSAGWIKRSYPNFLVQYWTMQPQMTLVDMYLSYSTPISHVMRISFRATHFTTVLMGGDLGGDFTHQWRRKPAQWPAQRPIPLLPPDAATHWDDAFMSLLKKQQPNTLRPEQNDRHFTRDSLPFVERNCWHAYSILHWSLFLRPKLTKCQHWFG